MEVVRGSEINKLFKGMNEKILIIAVELLLLIVDFLLFDDDFLEYKRSFQITFFYTRAGQTSACIWRNEKT